MVMRDRLYLLPAQKPIRITLLNSIRVGARQALPQDNRVTAI
jgi:hypothetical protein